MSILGSVADYFNSGTPTTGLTALRAALAAGTMYADLLPDNLSRPFVVLGESGTAVLAERKGASNRSKVLETTVSYEVYGRDRAQAESILELLETAYLEEGVLLTVSARQHIATTFSDRVLLYDGEGWLGTLSLNYRLVKSV